jgi:regulator of replication initiation timing
MSNLVSEFTSQIRALSIDNQSLREKLSNLEEIKAIENEKRKKVHLSDQPDYEDRVRSLLIDLEQMSKNN